jgi:L-ribulokinase
MGKRHDKYVIGIDFGTDSVRSVLVNALNGEIAGSSVFEYPVWKKGQYCDPSVNSFRQHPSEYTEGLIQSVNGSLYGIPDVVKENIEGISIDTTGSTPVAVDHHGVPLALRPGFENDPDAMFILWKDHTAIQEALEINSLAHSWDGPDYTRFEGGIYSSEWFWAKILHILRKNKNVRNNAWSWVEHCDWMPALLTGNTDPIKIKRSRCAAGHKAMWHKSFNGLPDEGFLSKIDPLLSGLRERLYKDTWTTDTLAGELTAEWAEKLGLRPGIKVGTGTLDAHAGAVGAGITPFNVVKVMGTSTCDMIVAPLPEGEEKPVSGICGQVDGSIVPGFLGLEAGQSAFGDIYAWFAGLLMWPFGNIVSEMSWLDDLSRKRIGEEASEKIISELSRQAQMLPPEKNHLIAVDWMNGRRTPDANEALKGALTGLTLGSDAPRIFRALVEATAFGSRMINDRFISEGIRVDGVIAIGGVARKNPFVMQVVADVLNRPIKMASPEHTCALGSAMAASVVAGIHHDVPAAQRAMGGGFDKTYNPDPENSRKYDSMFSEYRHTCEFIERRTIR